MSEGTLFRVFVLIFLLLGLGIRVYFHRKAGTLQDSIQERREGGVLLVPGLLMVGWFAGMGFFLIEPDWLHWSNLRIPVWLRWTGVALSVVGTPFFIWVHHVLGKSFSGLLYIQKDHSLIQAGPYRWIRHPMYTAYFFGHIGYLLMTANWFIGATGLLTITMIMVFRVPREEAALIEKFGDAYREYILRTGRFLPRFPDRRRA